MELTPLSSTSILTISKTGISHTLNYKIHYLYRKNYKNSYASIFLSLNTLRKGSDIDRENTFWITNIENRYPLGDI